MTVAEILFWLSAFALFHSYLLYPALLRVLTRGRKGNTDWYGREDLPGLTVLMAVYNEAAVVVEKIDSVFGSGYPPDRLQVIVGSDCSTDGTDALVRECMARYPQLELVPFERRSGKVVIINDLVKRARHDLLVLTDADVMIGKGTLYALARHFRNGRIALVDSNMVSRGLRKEGIARQEKTYIRTEVLTKHAEGLLAGCMMGPFGGCYAVRKSCYPVVPPHFLVDDFYVNMHVLARKGRCINDLGAEVYEDASHFLSEEFRRKVRIATGNFQNLFAFRRLLFRFDAVAFCFWSHKALRWFGPLFLAAALVSNLFLLHRGFYAAVFALQAAFYLSPAVDWVLRRLHLHVGLLRFATHLLSMNAALLTGLFRFLRGVDSSIWEPTRRHQ
jgi:cellulose synthase/poly-beta-1,6-N-acetylglucosamine synthase-like glycosyltransferase